MADYTVIGVYDDGASFVEHVSAFGPNEAMARAAYLAQDPDDLQIIGAILGWMHLIPACDESGNAAYAVDLIDEEITG